MKISLFSVLGALALAACGPKAAPTTPPPTTATWGAEVIP